MNVPFFNYQRFLSAHSSEIDEVIHKVLSSGTLILGDCVKHFEREFATYTGTSYAIGVANGTDALFLALKALEINEGDEILTVPNTAVPTIAAIVSCGAIPKFIDITLDSYLLNPALIEKAITKKTKAILPVHLYGNSCDMKAITAIAKKYKLPIIEDCAQAHGTLFKGKHVGSFGICGCFSFYPTKNLGAYGDGGMVITNNAPFARKIRALRNYGQYKLGKNIIHGFNSRLDELQAALLSVHLKYLNQRNNLRHQHAKQYYMRLNNIEGIICPKIHHNATFHQFVILINDRDNIRKELLKKGIATGIHYPMPIYKQKAYSYLNRPCPISEMVQPSILSLPIFPELTSAEIDYVCNALISLM